MGSGRLDGGRPSEWAARFLFHVKQGLGRRHPLLFHVKQRPKARREGARPSEDRPPVGSTAPRRSAPPAPRWSAPPAPRWSAPPAPRWSAPPAPRWSAP